MLQTQLPIPLLLTLLAPCLLAERPAAGVEQSLRQARQKLKAAQRAADAAQIERFLADDFLALGVYGDTRDKATYVKSYRRGAERAEAVPAEAEPIEEEVQIRQYGEVAVVTGRLTYDTPIAAVCFTQVWVQEKDGWRLASVHNSIPAVRRKL